MLQPSGKLNMLMDTEPLIVSKTCKFSYHHYLTYMTGNRRYNANGEAVYMTAALGVIMNTDNCGQKFFGSKKVKMTNKFDGDDLDHHRDDIISIDISTDRKTVVTGETG